MTPGKAGGLLGERLKGAGICEPPKAADLPAELHLIVALVLGFLVPDIGPYHVLVEPNGRNEITARPKMLSREIAFSTAEFARDLNRALALEVAHHIGNRLLRRDADANVDVIPHQVAFHDLRLLVPGEVVKYCPEVAAQRPENALLPAFRYEHHVIFAVPSSMAQALVLFHL